MRPFAPLAGRTSGQDPGVSAKPADEGPARQADALNRPDGRQFWRRDGSTSARPAESAVDLAEASCFRSFAAVNGLRPPEAARERAPLTAAKLRKVLLP